MATSSTGSGLGKIILIIGGALILGMIGVKIWFASTVFFGDVPADTPSVSVVQTSSEVVDDLDSEERISRDMVTPVVPGTPVMPDAGVALDPSDYSRDLARFIPIEIGMDRYAANDELLLYYNDQDEAEMRAKVSSTERMIDGATLFVIRRSGLADDAVAAEETYALYDAGVLVDFGSRIQCRRGPNPNSWTTELCP